MKLGIILPIIIKEPESTDKLVCDLTEFLGELPVSDIEIIHYIAINNQKYVDSFKYLPWKFEQIQNVNKNKEDDMAIAYKFVKKCDLIIAYRNIPQSDMVISILKLASLQDKLIFSTTIL